MGRTRKEGLSADTPSSVSSSDTLKKLSNLLWELDKSPKQSNANESSPAKEIDFSKVSIILISTYLGASYSGTWDGVGTAFTNLRISTISWVKIPIQLQRPVPYKIYSSHINSSKLSMH